jgi:hypothetical protein
VATTFRVVKPSYTILGRMVVGAADRGDEVERGAVLIGKRLDVKEGEPLTVVGVVKVIDHGGSVVNGVTMQPWSEIRIEEK